MSHRLFARDALLPDGWAKDVVVVWDDAGVLTDVRVGATPDGAEQASGPLLPGLPNLHSHAFQRAFAGLTEVRGTASTDSFWTWRTRMYDFASRIGPESLQAIATWLYVEMLEAGYTSVCEFHYVHHRPDGRPHADAATMSHALIAAARTAGIGLTLLPVLYQTGGFGGKPAHDDQRRFLHDTGAMLALLDALRPTCIDAGVRLGLAPHSLRAVPEDALRAVVAGLHAADPTAPIHIHIAEQTGEVDECLAWSGARPVQWLLDHVDVDARWCLVHATHMDATEHARAAATGAVAGLCPTTEANLGDGLFDFAAWRDHGGAWGIGSDSHVCVNAAEELSTFEYGQRLVTRTRNVGATATEPVVATALLDAAVRGGARAAGRPIAGIAVGQQADLVVLDADHLALAGLGDPSRMLSAHVFASHRTSAIDGVWTAGRRRVAQGRHAARDEAMRAFVATRASMLADR